LGIYAFLLGRITLRTEPRHGLEQFISLLPNPLKLCSVLTRPLSQGRETVLSLIGVSTSVRLPDLDVGHLLGDRSKLGHLLTSGVELLGLPSTQLRLFGKAVLGILLVT
jgi:hypothetical protein